MNYLAHLLLSGPDPDWRLGGLLGDFVKGPLKGERPEAIEAGIRLHRRIDALTDQHPVYLASLPLLEPQWRRYAGIVVDIWFDHILSQQWPRWQQQPLEDFCGDCWHDFRARSAYIPERAQLFIDRAEQFALLQNYADEAVIEQSLARVGQRLRHPVALQQTMPQLRAAQTALQENFTELFTDLTREAAQFRRCYKGNNQGK
jgi:acyl carrier protein phosphodiesterase